MHDQVADGGKRNHREDWPVLAGGSEGRRRMMGGHGGKDKENKEAMVFSWPKGRAHSGNHLYPSSLLSNDQIFPIMIRLTIKNFL